MNSFTESTVEDAALAWVESLGWSIAYGPNIAPDSPAAERADYGGVVGFVPILVETAQAPIVTF